MQKFTLKRKLKPELSKKVLSCFCICILLPNLHYNGGTEALKWHLGVSDCLMLLRGGINEFTQQF